jgi:hypothetical protein
MRVWISYSSKDSNFATRLREDLTVMGIQTWLADDTVSPGDNWVEKIASAIESSDAILIVLSRESIQSPSLTSEMAFALSAKRASKTKLVIPLLLDKELKLPVFLSSIQYLDFSRNEKYKESLDSLIRALTSTSRVYIAEQDSADLRLRYLQAQKDLLEAEKQELAQKRLRVSLRIALVTTLATILITLGVVVASFELTASMSNIVLSVVSFIIGVLAAFLTSYLYRASARRTRKEVK